MLNDPLDWLTEDETTHWLEELADTEPTPSTVARLRKRTSPERASRLLEIAEIRHRASVKFSRASKMFFTRKGYEQATDEWVAHYKARRFANHQQVIDLCSGVGGDLLGLATAGLRAQGMDRDPTLARYAELNVSAYGLAAEVLPIEAGDRAVDGADAWHADPDRRPAGRRTSQPDDHEPSLAQLETWRTRCPQAAVKLAPAARLPEAWQTETELEWISRGGECRQLVAWCGSLAVKPGLRRATRVLATPQNPTRAHATLVGNAGLAVQTAEKLGAYLYEPDAAVLAADLDGAIAHQHGLEAISQSAAYLTGHHPIKDPLLSCFEVIETIPFDRRKLARWLAERSIGRLEIKCRGVDVRPEQLRKELKPRGDHAITLLLCPRAEADGNKPQVIAADRVVPS